MFRQVFLSRLRMYCKKVVSGTKSITGKKKGEGEIDYGILDYVPVAMIAVNSQGVLTGINSAAERILDLTREEVLGRSFEELASPRVVLDWPHPIFDFIGDTLYRGIVYDEVELCARIGGNKGIIKVSTCLFKNGDKVAGVLLMVKDYTEIKLLEEQVQRNECLTVVGQMAAGICHEIRNPLQSVKGFVQLLQEQNKGNQGICCYTDIVISEINRINAIIKEFLQLARPSETRFERKDLNSLVREVVMLVNSEAILRNIVIEERYGKKIPFLMLDEARIKQVLVNLLFNALAAIPCAGTIKVATWYDFYYNEARIMVADNGVGMDAETLAHIGSPFFTTKEEGTGLGLAVSYRIIQDHGGRIQVESDLGKGTTFTVILPELAGLGEKARGFSA